MLSSIVTTPSTGTITLNGRTLPDGTDNTIVSITATIIDSEGSSRNVTDSISLSKVKNAAPISLALLSSETQTILSSSAGFAAPATFTTIVTEGGSGYTYDSGLSSVNTYYISSITGGTNSNGTITPTTPTTTTGTTTSITISYKNSEGTAGTITKTHKVAVSLEGSKGVDGTPGSTGNDGKRTATGMVHYQVVATSAPTTPTATSFTFSNGTFGGLTSNWGTGAPTYASGNSNKYWYATYSVVETTAEGCVGKTLSQDVVVIPVNVEELSNQMLLYPNPATTELNLQITSNLIGTDLFVFDALGKQILKQQILSTNTTINTSSFAAGNYVVKVGGVVKRFEVKK